MYSLCNNESYNNTHAAQWAQIEREQSNSSSNNGNNGNNWHAQQGYNEGNNNGEMNNEL